MPENSRLSSSAEPSQSPHGACEVPWTRLTELLPTLVGLIEREPLVVKGPGGERFFLVAEQALGSLPIARESDALSRQAGTTGSSPTMADCADWLMEAEHQRVRMGQFSEGSWHIMRNRLDRHILPALGHLPMSAIDRKSIGLLLQRLLAEQASPTTQSQYLVIVRKMLKLAHQEKWITEVPDLPSIRVDSKPRSALTVAQYGLLLKHAKRLHRQQATAPTLKTGTGQRSRFWITTRYRTLPWDMYALIIFMVNAFVRPSDIKNLQHQHIEVVRGSHAYLRMTLPESKRHDKPMVSLQPAVRVYEALRERWAAQGMASPTDHVFLPQEKDREHALGLFNFWLKWILREAGLPLTDPNGQARTLYCLRHTAITFRLLYGEGIDMLTLARNARTSVDMIEKFYASTLTGEMNIGMLQSRRGAKKTPGLARG